MGITFNIKTLVLTVCAVIMTSALLAQQTNSDSLSVQNRLTIHDSHKMNVYDFAVPAAVFGISAWSVYNPWLIERRNDFQDLFSAHTHKTNVDNYIQYLPTVSLYVLNLANVKGIHNFKDRTIILAISAATMELCIYSMKAVMKEPRPDNGSTKSFPSGHTATAFMGAELLYREYRDSYPWIGIIGYGVATATGCLRIYNNRHWVNDVLAGAAIGIMSTKFAYWIYPKIFRDTSHSPSVVCMPFYNGAGLNLAVFF